MASLKSYRIFLLLISLLAAAFVVICTSRYGIGLTHDSGYYVYAARTFLSGGTMLDIHNNPLVIYTGLLPLILSSAQLIGLDSIEFMRYFNAVNLLLVIFLGGIFLDRIIENKILKYLCLLSIVFSTPLFMNYVFLWSDGLLILLLYFLIYSLSKFVEKEKKLFLIIAIVCTILCWYQRYLGIVGIITGSCILLFSKTSWSRNTRIKYLSIYSISSFFLISLWFIRNYLLSGKMTSSYDAPRQTFAHNLKSFLNVLSSYYLPDEINISIRIALVLSFFAVVFYMLRKYPSYQNPFLISLITFVLCNIIFLLLLNIRFSYYTEDYERYLSPLYIPIMIVSFKTAEIFLERNKTKLTYLILSILILWLAYPFLRFSKNFYHWYSKGGSYQSVHWKDDKLVKFIAEHNFNTRIVSNNPIPLILLAGKEASTLPDDPAVLNQPAVFVKWNSNKSLNYNSFDIKNYQKHFRFEKIYASLNGAIYKISPRDNGQRRNK